jgi:signal transduction histidine kinase
LSLSENIWGNNRKSGPEVKLSFFSFEWFPFLTKVILHNRIAWSIRLRWIAVAGYLAATIIARYSLKINVPYDRIWMLLGIIIVTNLGFFGLSRLRKELSFGGELIVLHIHIIFDLLLLTAILHYSGGIENPVYLFFVFHVVISSIIFPGLIPLAFATFVVFLFAGLIYLEYNGIIDHYSILSPGLHVNPTAIILTLVVFTVTVYVSTYICSTFMQIYRRIKREIDAKNEALVEIDRQKTNFFVFSSHELKSPIIAVKSSIDGIVKNYADKLDERGLNILRRASLRSDQMLQILKELLDLTRNRTGQTQRIGETIDLNEVLREMVRQVTEEAKEKKVRLMIRLDKNPAPIKGDAQDFRKIFGNLITNAIRYSHQNSEVHISSRHSDNSIEFVFADKGIGIPEKDLSLIFNEFFRSENARRLLSFGTGLGLTLTKQLVENYGGTISVSSEINSGSVFTVRIPVQSNAGGSRDKV